MRSLFAPLGAFVIAGLTAGPALAGPEAPTRAPAPRYLVGQLLEEGVERCLADFKVEWVNRYHVVGFTPLKPAEGVDVAKFAGRLVAVSGAVDPSGLGRMAPVKHERECVIAQMRSDWVNTLSGMRVMRPGMGTVAGAFTANAVRPWQGLSAKREGDELLITAKPDLPVDLVDVDITVHYEGCYGKPGTTRRTKRFATIPRDKQASVRLPTLDQDDDRPTGRGTHRAYSVQLTSLTPEVAFDLDISLHVLGVDVACPDRRKVME